MIQPVDRILTPLIRRTEGSGDGTLIPCTFEEAYLHIAKRLQIISSQKENSLGVAISDKYTSEEIFLMKEFASAIGASAFSLGGIRSGLADILGKDSSTCTFEEMLHTDVILMVGSDMIRSHTIASLRVKQAVENGAKLILVSDKISDIDEWATIKITSENLHALGQMLNYIAGVKKEDDLKGYAEKFGCSCEVDAVAEMYLNAKKAVIVFEQKALTTSAAQILGNIAVLSGHIGKPRSGVIQLKQNNNSQGLTDLGIGEKQPEDSLKGLIIFGEDALSSRDLSELDFLVVCDTMLTETAQRADVVLPASSYAESTGNYTNTVGQTVLVNAAIDPLAGKDNRCIVLELASALGTPLPYCSNSDLSAEMAKVKDNLPAVQPSPKIPEDSSPGFVKYGNTHAAFVKFQSEDMRQTQNS
jgi:formate dehydrogenase major subunit